MVTILRNEIEERVRVAGLKLTPQRFAVLDYLMRSVGHPTVEEITGELNRRFPRASRATVYNTLHALCDVGLVREMFINGGVARYDSVTSPHYHFVCRSCGTLEDIPARPQFPEASSHVHLKDGYHAEACDVLIRGLCAACGESRVMTENGGSL